MPQPVASERSEWVGVWWLPSDRDLPEDGRAEADGVPEAVPLGQGTLTYEPEVGLWLRLAGIKETGARPLEGLAFTRSASISAVHGRLLDGQICTLLDSFVRDHDGWHPGGGWSATVRANSAILGAHVLTADELEFAEADLRIRGLREFLRQPPVNGQSAGSVLRAEGDQRSVSIELDGATVTFGLGWSTRSTANSEFREVDAVVHIALDRPAPWPTWEELWTRRVRDLVVFATREPAWIESFTAFIRDVGSAQDFHPAIRRAAPNEVWETDAVHVVRVPTALRREPRESRYSRVVFGPDDLGSHFERFVRAWFDQQARLGPAAAFLIGSLSTPSEYLENRLLNLTAFAEAYHRTFHDDPPLSADDHARLTAVMLDVLESKRQRNVYRSRLDWANQQTQRKRFDWLVQRTIDLIGDFPGSATLTGTLADTRNHFAHLGERGSNVVTGAHLLAVVNRLVLVLQANLLMDLGVPKDLALALIRRNYASGWP